MRNGLGELGQLLHAKRIRSHQAIARLTQADVHESFVGAFHGLIRRKTGEFGHIADETNAGHLGDERVGFRHVPDQRSQRLAVSATIETKHPDTALGRPVETQKRIDERGFPGAIRAEQADRAAVQNARQAAENGSPTELHLEPDELYCRSHGHKLLRMAPGGSSMIGLTEQTEQSHHTRIQVEELAIGCDFDTVRFPVRTNHARL